MSSVPSQELATESARAKAGKRGATLVFPDPAPPALTQALSLASYTWKAVGIA